MKRATFVVLMCSIVFAGFALAQATKHFDLKGETLGESLESFQKIHPSARCHKNPPEKVPMFGEDTCTVHRGISFAGLPALTDPDCDQIESKPRDGRNCSQGLTATFRDGKLVKLQYIVDPMGDKDLAYDKVMDALTHKYGKPEHSGWSNNSEMLTVGVGGSFEEHASTDFIIVLLCTKEDYSKKDI
jgi:hypothetical protein